MSNLTDSNIKENSSESSKISNSQNLVSSSGKNEILEISLNDRVKRILEQSYESIQTIFNLPKIKKLLQEGNYSYLVKNINNFTPEIQGIVLRELIPIINKSNNLELIKLALENLNFFKIENLNIKNIYSKLINLDPNVIIKYFEVFKPVINPNELANLVIKEGLNVPYEMLIFFDVLESTQQNLLINSLLTYSNAEVTSFKQSFPLVDSSNQNLINILYERAIQARRPNVLLNNMDLFLTLKSEIEIMNDLSRIRYVQNKLRAEKLYEQIYEKNIPVSKEEEEIVVNFLLESSDHYRLVYLLKFNKLKFINKDQVIDRILLFENLRPPAVIELVETIISGDERKIRNYIEILINKGDLNFLQPEFLIRTLQKAGISLEEFGFKILDRGDYGLIEKIITLFPENVIKRFEEVKNKNEYNYENLNRELVLAKEKLEFSKDAKEKQKYEQIISGLEYLLSYDQKVREELSETLGSDIVEMLLGRINYSVNDEVSKFCHIAVRESITPIQALGLFQSKVNKLVNDHMIAFKAMDAGDLINVIGDRFKSQHELFGKRSKPASKRIIMTEGSFFGRDFNTVPIEKAPIYGYPSTLENGMTSRSGKYSESYTILAYGGVIVRLNKEKVARKTTMCFQDSLNFNGQFLFTFFSHPHFSSFSYGLIDSVVTMGYYEIDDPDFSINTASYNRSDSGYSELQLHNGLYPQDIEEIVIDDRYSPSDGGPINSKEEIEAIKETIKRYNLENPNNQIRIRICRTDKNGGVIWIE